MRITRHRLLPFVAACIALGAGAAGAAPSAAPSSGGAVRSHDQHRYVVAEADLPFAALADPAIATDRWWGVESGAGYRIEVPRNWNGELVMYAHGYRGEGDSLIVSPPRIRRELVSAGYAWAASSYSANGYDVRSGIEDTNALALAVVRIAHQHGRTLAAPRRVYIIGHSMGGHIAGAAVEAETLRKAHHKLRYAGSMPMCGVMGDLEIFNYFVAYSLAAQKLAGSTPVGFPPERWRERAPQVLDYFFSSFPSEAAPDTPIVLRDRLEARELEAIVMNLTGGPRPIFAEGFARSSNAAAWSTFGMGPEASGILLKSPVSTEHTVYRFEDGPRETSAESAFNASMPHITPEPDANPVAPRGLRFVPPLSGEIDVPVLTLHNLGDVFVPFNLEQIYKRRIAAKHNEHWLVQRAIRSPLHCDFTAAEEAAAFTALAAWVEHGTHPAGDDVTTAARVADPAYGCAFTDNRASAEEPDEAAVRAAMPACPAR